MDQRYTNRAIFTTLAHLSIFYANTLHETFRLQSRALLLFVSEIVCRLSLITVLVVTFFYTLSTLLCTHRGIFVLVFLSLGRGLGAFGILTWESWKYHRTFVSMICRIPCYRSFFVDRRYKCRGNCSTDARLCFPLTQERSGQ